MSIDLLITPRARDLGSFSVRRALPHAKRRTVGPFIFFDHLGPLRLPPGEGMDVRVHPHIGLATVTWLFEGALEHRDSLGSVQVIRAGDVNWMTAGRGISHSERSPASERVSGVRMHGIQTWVALPQAFEEIEPAFHHHPAASLPRREEAGVSYCLIAGTAFGLQSPVEVFSPMFYLAIDVTRDARIEVPGEHAERAVYVASGSLRYGDGMLAAGQMAIFSAGAAVELIASEDAQLVLFGGAPLDGARHVWWNFVSSSRGRIELAKADWTAQRFGSVPGESEFIPLPDK